LRELRNPDCNKRSRAVAIGVARARSLELWRRFAAIDPTRAVPDRLIERDLLRVSRGQGIRCTQFHAALLTGPLCRHVGERGRLCA
jgi:hypothetical protein